MEETVLQLDGRQLVVVDFALRENLQHVQRLLADHNDCTLGEPCTLLPSNESENFDPPSCYYALMRLHEEAALLASVLHQLDQGTKVRVKITGTDKAREELGKLLNESGQHDEGTTTSLEIPDQLLADVEAIKDVPSISIEPFEFDPALVAKLHPESATEKSERLSHEFDKAVEYLEEEQEPHLPTWPKEDTEVAIGLASNDATQFIHPIKPESTEALTSPEERRSFLDRFSKNK